jgi:calcium-dependent protein kinase
VILYILLCGKPPFPGKNEQEIFSKITRGVVRFSDHKWKNISKEAKELIFKMLCKDLNQRISASEAFSHPWVQNSQTQTIKTSEISPKVIQNLSHFQAGSRLQQVTLSFIASIMFSGQEMKELREAFIILDTNGDGHLTKDELQRGFSTISISGSARLEDILADCDIDMNGMIDYSEFLTAALDWQKHLSEEMLEKAFKAYDRDESGGISIREIKQFLGAGEDEPDDIWDDILKEADENGDGEIDMSEFKTLMFSRFKLK